MPFPDRSFFDQVYAGAAPWDIGAGQPDLLELIERLPPTGRVLDLGCGTGDLAIDLARRGIQVLGIDFVPAALDVARARASALPRESARLLDFEVGDALRPSAYAGTIGAVVDSGFFHLFEAGPRRDLVDELGRALPPGGRYYMLGFAIAIPAPDVPLQVTADEIRELFGAREGWVIRELRDGRFMTTGFDAIPAVAVCAERRPDPSSVR